MNTWCQLVDPSWRWTDLEMGHELYCAGHLFQAGVAFARTTGDDPALGRPRFADLIDSVFGTRPSRNRRPPRGRARACRALPPDRRRRYLELADTLISRRGHGSFADGLFDLDYYQDAEPVREARSIVGHAVRALYLAAGVTDLYAETGDEALLESMLRQWDDCLGEDVPDRRNRLPSLRRGDRRPVRAAAGPRLLRDLCGHRQHHVELADAARDGRESLCRPLRAGALQRLSLRALLRRPVILLHQPAALARRPRRHEWNPVACCPPNIMRCSHRSTITSALRPTRLQLHQYALRDRADSPARVRSSSPWRPIPLVGNDRAPARLDPRCRLDAVSPDPGMGPDGDDRRRGGHTGRATRLTRSWSAGDNVLELDVSPRLTAPNPQIDAVRGCAPSSAAPSCTASSGRPAARDRPRGRRPDPRPRRRGPDRAARRRTRRGDRGRRQRPRRLAQARYATSALPGGRRPGELRAVPYFAWANRGTGGMRVWIPRRTRSEEPAMATVARELTKVFATASRP